MTMDVKDISFMDPKVQVCPFEAYKAVREAGPVFVDPATGWYFITDYELVKNLTNDTVNLSSYTGLLMSKQKSEVQDKLDHIYATEGYPQVPALVVMDPPDHGFHRSFVDKAFTPARVKAMESYLEGVVDQMIDAFIEKPEVEFRTALAALVPQAVIADALGMPRSDLPKLKRWTDAVISNQDQSHPEEKQLELAHIICELHRYAAEKVESFRGKPAECLLSDFANTKVDGRSLSMKEVAAICEQVMAGGNDSSANAILNAMIRLIEKPALQEQLRANRELIPAFVEETLRLDAPVQGLFREPKKDLEIGGVKIPKGSVVVLKWGAANRDPAQFPEPDEIRMDRPNLRRHLTFGFGPHTCVGAQLARGELRVVLNKLFDRMKNFRYARGAASVERETHFFVYAPRALYLSFDRV